MEQKTKRWTQYRSSITGRYCSAAFALLHPDTTQSITREQEPLANEPETNQEQN